jgi:enoyl-CoA hydratase
MHPVVGIGVVGRVDLDDLLGRVRSHTAVSRGRGHEFEPPVPAGARRSHPIRHTGGVIHRESHDGYSVVTLDRPERANALDADHCDQIRGAVEQAMAGEDRAVVITGVGRAFSAGADFGGVTDDGFSEAHYGMLHTIVDAPVPVVAAVNGHAIGAGMQLAIACDLRVVADGASFAIPTARLGLAVDPWTIERLASLVGGGPARRILMTCDRVGADDPALAPLIDRWGGLDEACELAADLATMAPLTLGYIKTTLNAWSRGEQQSPAASDAFRAVWESEDSREGLQAQRDRRSPTFSGR